MATYAYFDNSNIFIEGQRVSAVRKKLARNIMDATTANIVDFSWQIDYGRLYEFIFGTDARRDVDAFAQLWGSPPPGDSFWNMLERKGFHPTVYQKNFSGREKKG